MKTLFDMVSRSGEAGIKDPERGRFFFGGLCEADVITLMHSIETPGEIRKEAYICDMEIGLVIMCFEDRGYG